LTDGDVNQQSNKVKALKIAPFFESVFYSDSFGVDKRKPNAFMYLKIIEKYKIAPAQILNIGDNPKKDFHVYKSLGINSIQIIRENSVYSEKFPYYDDVKPSKIIKSFSEVQFK
jgi:putative hydrolase of the HAD superfamily